MFYLVLILMSAWLNRVRGGGLGGQYLPGHPRIYVALILATFFVFMHMGVYSLVAAGLWFLWSIVPHGHFYQFGLNIPSRPWTKTEKLCWKLGGQTNLGAMYVRNVSIIPFVLFLAYYSHSYILSFAGWLVPLLMTLQRSEMMKKYKYDAGNGVQNSELVDGAIIGIFIAYFTSIT